MLKIDNASARIAGITVLRDITTEFKPGQLLAVVGRNGAGKTTLLRAIMGLLPLSSGRISIEGHGLSKIPGHRRTEYGIGYAPEDRIIFPTLSVEENLALPCDVLGLSARAVKDRQEAVLQVVPQLKDMLKRSGAALSGGQGKMVALGRALMVGQSLVLLDEPLQGLAPVLAQQYVEAIGRLRQWQPALCVVITESNAGLLSDIPDQTWFLERGALTQASKTHLSF
jgi:branched-chain amino acid transport system ATP-binding protein